MQWNEGFVLGIPSIDAQHKELVSLLIKLQAAIQKGECQAVYANTIRALVEYTRLHFADEEAYMQSIHYPHLDEHRKIHEALVSDIKNILMSLKQNKPIQPISLMRFLNEWVCKHIMDQDMKIGVYLKNQRRIQSSVMSTSDPFGDERTALLAKFQSLAKQREQKAITDEAFGIKCSEILDTEFKDVTLSTIKGLEKALSFIVYLVKQNLIAGDEKTIFDKVLVKKALALNITAIFPDAASRMNFLKGLHDEMLLTSDDYELYKNAVLK